MLLDLTLWVVVVVGVEERRETREELDAQLLNLQLQVCYFRRIFGDVFDC